jgi:hypothetical protein
VLVFAAFGRSLGNGFTYDDFPTLVDNAAVREASPWQVLTDPGTHTTDTPPRTYRPLRTLLFQAQHEVFGLHAAGFHLVSLLLHAGAAMQVLVLVRRLLGGRIALPVALVFACHPLVSEVVVSVKAQDDLLATNVVLWACRLFLDRATASTVCGWVSVSLLFGLGLLAKESAMILPVLGAGLAASRLPAVATARPHGLLLCAWLALVAGAFLLLRQHLLAVAATGTAPAAGLLPTSLALVPVYWLQFVWPFALSADYSGVPLLDAGSIWLWVSVAAQAASFAVLWRTGRPATRVGIVLGYVALAPGLNFTTAYAAVAERFAYLAVAGFGLVACDLAGRLADRLADRLIGPPRARLAVRAAVLAVLAVASFLRCGVWRDNETLFRATAANRWSSPIVQRFLIEELLRQGRTDEAAGLLRAGDAGSATPPQTAMERRALTQAALVAMQRGDWQDAADRLAQVTASPLARPSDWLNYGTALVNLGRAQEAATAFTRVLAAEPDHTAAMRMLGRLAFERADFAAATGWFRRANDRAPRDANGRYFLVLSLWRGGDVAAAAVELRRTVADGIDLQPLLAADAATWSAAPEPLREALRTRPAGGR